MNRNCLLILRFTLNFWVGAAVLFVITSVREQVSPDLSDLTKNTLAVIRFPAYYTLGFVLLGFSAIVHVLLLRTNDRRRHRYWWTFGLLVASLLVMAIDYVFVYQPLEAMMLTGEVERTDRFTMLHETSKYLNFFELVCLTFATFQLNR